MKAKKRARTLKLLIRGAGSILAIYPEKVTTPERNVSKRIATAWSRTGTNLFTAISRFADEQQTESEKPARASSGK